MVDRILTCPTPWVWLLRFSFNTEPDGDCWRWTGPLDSDGYGQFRFRVDGRRRNTGAHRAAWLAYRGDIPDQLLVVDHLCRNKACVNPWHMELVSNYINCVVRAVAHPAGPGRPLGSGKYACGRHDREDGYEVANDENGYRRWVCRICARAAMARYKERREGLDNALVVAQH